VIEPTREVDSVAGEVKKECHLVGWPAYNVSAAHHQWRDDGVATDCVQYWTIRLNTTDDITGINNNQLLGQSQHLAVSLYTWGFFEYHTSARTTGQ